MRHLTPKTEPGYFYQMGNPPLRVDVMMEIPGGDFNEAWKRRNTVSIGKDPVHFISREDLISVKLASGRDQDLKDVDAIRKSQPDA